MAVNVQFSARDRDNKLAKTSLSAADAVTDPQIVALATAITNVSRAPGFAATKNAITYPAAGDPNLPTDGDANRGVKWFLRTSCLDGNGSPTIIQNYIGIADHSLLTPGNDTLDLTAGVGLALKNAWEAVFLSKYGTTGTLLSCQQVTITD